MLKDAYVGQVMSYFTNRDDTRGLKLAYVAKHGLMTGVGNGRFNPDGAVTRAMVWTVLARMAGEDTDGGATWYSKAQIWATETGLINGINGYLKPQSGATRAQLATMLMRFTA